MKLVTMPCYIRVGPKYKMTGVFMRRGETETQTDTERQTQKDKHKAMGRQRQSGVMHLQAKEHQGLPAVIFPTALRA